MSRASRFEKFGITVLITLLALGGLLSFNNEKASAEIDSFEVHYKRISQNQYESDIYMRVPASSGDLSGRAVRYNVTNSSGKSVASGSTTLKIYSRDPYVIFYDVDPVTFIAPGGPGTNYRITWDVTIGTTNHARAINFVLY